MKTCRKDFQGRKSTTVLKLLCRNIAAGRFNWRRYCTPQTYFGQEICVTPLHCSYGQIGYTVHFPYSNMPEVEYDWVKGWGIDELASLVKKAGKLYFRYKNEIERECTDDEFMAMFEQYPEFDDLDDLFVENEETWTGMVACYVDEHIERFVTVEE